MFNNIQIPPEMHRKIKKALLNKTENPHSNEAQADTEIKFNLNMPDLFSLDMLNDEVVSEQSSNEKLRSSNAEK